MKLFIVTGLFPPDIGGPATYTKTLVEELPHNGDFYVEVLSFGEVRHLPKIIRHIVFFFKILLRGRKSDLLFAQDPVSVGLPTMLASLFLRIPYVLKIVGDYAWEQGVLRFGVKDTLDQFVSKKYKHPAIIILRFIERKVAENARRIIVPSLYLKGIIEEWGVKKGKIALIYNGFNPPEVSLSKEELRQRLGIFETTITSAGRLVPWKGFDGIINAVGELKKRGKIIRLLIIGEGPERMKLARHIASLGLSEEVSLLGKLPKPVMLNYVEASDLFVLNSSYEGFSHQLLEVLSIGTPIIATDAGGNKEIIEDSVNGLVVPTGNQEALRESIENLLEDQSLQKQFEAEGKRTLTKFSEEIMVSKTAVLLQSL